MPNPRRQVEIQSLAEYIRAVKELPKDAKRRYWFRGQPSLHNWKIRPVLYRRRRFNVEDALYEEDLLRSHFVRLGRQLTSTPRDHWEWYFLMQHFGVPTRLLDWTDNALSALHFAVGESADETAPEVAVVFALDPHALNAEIFRRRKFPFSKRPSGVASPEWDVAQYWLRQDLFRTQVRVQYPIALDPPHLERRISAQGSRFTLFGRNRDGLIDLASALGDRFTAIAIAPTAVRGIRNELRACGVSHFTLFPDIAGLGRQLSLDWKYGFLSQ